MFHDLCFSSCHSLLTHIEFQVNHGGIDHIVDLSHSPYTRDDHFTEWKQQNLIPPILKLRAGNNSGSYRTTLSWAKLFKSSPVLKVWLAETVRILVSLRRTGHPRFWSFLAYFLNLWWPSSKLTAFPLQLMTPLANTKQFPPISRCCQISPGNVLGSYRQFHSRWHNPARSIEQPK